VGYLRFHEGTADPWPSYTERDLRRWAGRVRQTWPPDADVYVSFNNDPGGAAVVNSATFAALAATPASRSPGRPDRRDTADQSHPDVVTGTHRAALKRLSPG
jgi:uncharacterized protein YecE (DUF72 family)